jgi:FixJ family two-component response regulator
MNSESKVFIVDDDPSVRKSIARLISSVGLAVQDFPSAQEFLDSPMYEGPSCLVLDIRMPGLSGLDLQEELKNQQRIVPIIFITGHGDVPMSVRAMKAGAADFLEKPFNDQELIDAIHKALAKDQQTKIEQRKVSELKERVASLTPRENEIFGLVVRGLLNKQIAFDLDMSEKTVKVHRARVMKKMSADSLTQLVRMAQELGMFSQDDDL